MRWVYISNEIRRTHSSYTIFILFSPIVLIRSSNLQALVADLQVTSSYLSSFFLKIQVLSKNTDG
uniref:Uncharacterized protein n=1 Tax=Helianthus annuus TaxID=4232 RepID=A0A251RRE1_HELAN